MPSARSFRRPAILAMNKATQTNKQNPAAVAKAFLKANGLA